MINWHLITGEYPPQPGGVADYSQVIARGLVQAGDRVVIWAPEATRADAEEPGISIRRLPGHYGLRALHTLDKALGGSAKDRVLLQYTPHAFGYKALNFPLVLWLWRRTRRLDVMFHEVAYPFQRGQPLKHDLLAVAHRLMASLLIRRAERIFISIPAWKSMLRGLAPHFPEPDWIPIPSNLPVTADANAVARLRDSLGIDSTHPLVGHFGTYGPAFTRFLTPMLECLLKVHPSAMVALVGRGGDRFAAELLQAHPTWAARLKAPGGMPPEEAVTYLAACDLLVQPYSDGISSRRGSAVASLALGRPMVTTEGYLTEPHWQSTGAVEVVPPEQLGNAVLALLADPARREALGRRAAAFYRERFAVEHTIAALRRFLPPTAP